MTELLAHGLHILGADLERLNNNLTIYETKLVSNDKSNVIKGLVEYYRNESRLVRSSILNILKGGDLSPSAPVPSEPVPAEPTPVEPPSFPTPSFPTPVDQGPSEDVTDPFSA